MSIGYACLTIGVPETGLRTCTQKRANPELLTELIASNLKALDRILAWNQRNGIRMFRISSDLIPFGSSPVNALPWPELFRDEFARIGERIRAAGMRVSMHPGQYTVLNSPDADVVRRAVLDLEYHAQVLECLGTDATNKIILHVGGVYGDRPKARQRFLDAWHALDPRVQRRLIIENDERSWSAAEVFSIAQELGIPGVFDNLHHRLNPSRMDSRLNPSQMEERINSSPMEPEYEQEIAWVQAFSTLWRREDGPQKLHYSQQAPGQRPGAHSASIAIEPFLAFHDRVSAVMRERMPDIMLEVKDKNISAIKCCLCTTPGPHMKALEREWSRYKYTVLEHAPNVYQAVRVWLRDKSEASGPDRALGFYRYLEEALASPVTPGNGENAALHVWGYFKDVASDRERAEFFKRLDGYRKGSENLERVRKHLHALAVRHNRTYLTDSLFFAISDVV